ncbi:MAG: hypothetical protein O8C62_00230 [Candidatus Methanoperedens sp.]|nr:hypothetical protein [Candidatus Methanoperedens sp.]
MNKKPRGLDRINRMNRIYPVNPVIPSKNETSGFEIMEIYEPCYNISKFYYPAHQIYNYASGVVR